MTKTTVLMIAQAHLDPAWLWRWTEGRAEALATSQSAVDRLREYPDFQFVRGESQVYEWIEQENPQLFETIRELIRAGRWHVVNGMILQPDMNLPQGESLVRQFLLGKRYMQERLGVDPKVAYCVDSFGHAGTLPQIFRKCGCDHYVFMRPGPHEMPSLPWVFRWQAPDGSQVTAFRIAGAYASRAVDLRQHISRALDAKPANLDETMSFFGLGNHGGAPTIEQIERLHALQATEGDVELRFGSPAEFFAQLERSGAELPLVQEELYYHAVGCYSAHSALKRAHRQAECSLLIAERAAALAEIWTAKPASQAQLNGLWHDLCFNQFHDILGGCATKDVGDEAVMALGGVVAGARTITDNACRTIAAQIDTRGPGGNVVVFNPFPYSYCRQIEYEPWTEWEAWETGNWGLVDATTNEPVACQKVESHEALSDYVRNGVNRLLFRVDLPPLGYRTYRFARGLARTDVTSAVRATPTTLENEHLRLTIDPSSGAIASCVHVPSGLELAGPMAWNVMQVLEDTSDTWSHGISSFNQVIGQFGAPRITVAESGPLQASWLIERSYENSRLLQQVILRHNEPEITVRNWLFWDGQWRMLKLAFDVAADQPQAAHDVPFGWCYRPCDGSERPTQMWMDVSGRSVADPSITAGVALLNDGKYGCDVNGSTMRLTVLRCPPYAYHRPPHVFGAKPRYDWLDQGAQEFTVVLVPHVGDWRAAGVVQRARELNLPAPAVTTHAHPGPLPANGTLAETTSTEIELTALKAAEDGEGYIVRLADRHGLGGKGELAWGAQRFPIQVAPFEVLTLRLRRHGDTWESRPCNMIEQDF